jgi:hypothetical protein
VRDGRIVDCIYRGARGEKALYRLLASSKGTFVFVPGVTSPRDTIEASTEGLLMEAVRQADEQKEIMQQMPSIGAQIALARKPPAGLSEMADRIVNALGEETRGIDELLDQFTESDLDVVKGLKELLGANSMVVLDAGAERTQLCDEDEAVVLRAAALKLRPLGYEGAARLRRAQQLVHRAVAAVPRAVRHRGLRVGGAEPGGGRRGQPRHAGHAARRRRRGGAVRAAHRPRAARAVGRLPGAGARRGGGCPKTRPTRKSRDLLRALRVDIVQATEGWEHPQGAAETLRAALTSSTRPRVQSTY